MTGQLLDGDGDEAMRLQGIHIRLVGERTQHADDPRALRQRIDESGIGAVYETERLRAVDDGLAVDDLRARLLVILVRKQRGIACALLDEAANA